jgi:ribose transport system ATP-binding protein
MTNSATAETVGQLAGATEPRLEMAGVSKSFGRNTVLRNVSLQVLPGEVHALLGQNGSGKSTLIKVLSGLYRPDPGATIKVDGVEVEQPVTPAAIMRRGLTFVHQSLGLIPGHSVNENVRLGTLSRRRMGALIDWSHERRLTEQTLQHLQADIDPDRLVDELHMGERATVAIARALQSIVPGQGCVVLDESTQSLSREVLPEFYETVRRLARAGTSVLIVSHRLDEVLELADRVSVLRDGELVAAGVEVADLSEALLARQILGRELVGFSKPETSTPTSTPGSKASVIRLRGVSGGALDRIDLDLVHGEIVGVTGSTESGHEELPYLLTGVERGHVTGTIEINGTTHPLAGRTVHDNLDDGVVLVPSDRAGSGLAVAEDALRNLTLPRLRDAGRGRWLRRAWQRAEFDKACALLDITPRSAELPVSSFSGGNQQKILLAKWLLHDPALLVLHEPTQAVDVGARADILRAVSAAATAGAAVVICSIEAQDLALVCDRVLVLDEGRIACELSAPFTADDVLEAMS